MAHAHPDFGGTPGACLPAKRRGHVLDGAREPDGPLGAKWEQIGQPFGNGAVRASRIIAEKASHVQQQADRMFADWAIAWGAAVAALHPQRWLLTGGTGGLRCCAMGFDQESHIDCPDSVNGKAGKQKWQNRHGHRKQTRFLSQQDDRTLEYTSVPMCLLDRSRYLRKSQS